MIDIGVSAQQRDEFGVNHPRDLGTWMRLTDRRNRGQRMNDVAERAWLDDQNRFQISDFKLQIARSQSWAALFSNLKSKICNFKFRLSSDREPLGEQVRQAGLDDFLLRGRDVIFHAPLFDDVVLDVID